MKGKDAASVAAIDGEDGVAKALGVEKSKVKIKRMVTSPSSAESDSDAEDVASSPSLLETIVSVELEETAVSVELEVLGKDASIGTGTGWLTMGTGFTPKSDLWGPCRGNFVKILRNWSSVGIAGKCFKSLYVPSLGRPWRLSVLLR